mmetsp:Transcript_9348/g.23266  ORF Transcript_9348/g.23266 Transcript_9348/m.23266 type:complete len:248 (+) Transcript_9348:121-864(+)
MTSVLLLLLGLCPLPVASLAPVVHPNFLSAALGIFYALTSSGITQLPQPQTPYSENYNANNVPVLEVVKVYGKLAGSECYGKQAPKGSSCQINLNDLKQQLSSDSDSISKDDFEIKLKTMEFSWPLKPFGVDQSASLAKTAVMNKGAETMVFMQELETRGLYDPRNPTGPLPTSLRPSLNKMLQSEGIIDPRAIDQTYEILFGSGGVGQKGILLGGGDQDQEASTTGYLDYYDFLKTFGPNSISWPK